MHIILPLPKSAHPSGRVGPIEVQDWYRGLVKATLLLEKYRPAKILVLTAFHAVGEEPEMAIYLSALKRLGVDKNDIIVIEKARETIEQIEISTNYVKENNAELVIVSTFLHYLRVRWLCRGLNIEHHIAFGVPRPYEAVTDIILTVIFPIIDLLEKKKWFSEMVGKRRAKGKF